ncbi:MAG: acyl-CoA dehydrogenase [Hyphomicrobiaceae bacterium]|nr:MAG: acyl-CoA dehydrogenase [Hyphomicrobiaceae bacterium]
MAYQAPVDDIMHALKTAAGLDSLVAQGVLDGVDEDTIRAVIEEAGKFGAEVLEPLSTPGDRTGSKLVDGKVVTPPGWKEAYKQFSEGGWGALPCPTEFGGQNLPQVVATAAGEIWNAANLSFGLCPLLTQGAIDALEAQGSEELKRTYLPKMVTGEWTGTMNLTEPHAGSDLGVLKARAERKADGTYRIFGTKIFITYGDHEMTDNIVHLVLARLPDAPPGTRGISLFVVPKYLVNKDGSLGARNDVVCAGLEHKLGIHASPTCVMKYGEKDGAIGWLVGEENRGLNVMFIMMNAARLAVGVQGVAVAERATQRAIAYAKERRQGRTAASKGAEMAPIIEHADIRRNLMTMRALTQAARAICLVTARETDVSRRAKDAGQRAAAANRVALLTPIAKAFSTDIGCEVASIGIQVHGGMGFIEETGAAQIYRDARILPIYEGTNGIQAIDLVTRKLPLEGGKVVEGYIAELKQTVDEVRASNRPEFGRMAERLGETVAALAEASRWIGGALMKNPDAALAGAAPYLRLFGLAAGGVYLARGALAAVRNGSGAQMQPIALARFFAENLATAATGLKETVIGGADSTLALGPDALSA